MYGGAYGRETYGEIPRGLGSVQALGLAISSIDLSFTIYAATDEFATEPTDEPASTPFRGTLDRPLRFNRTIVGRTIGQFATGSGQLVIANTDGYYDFLPQSYAIDGRGLVVKIGRVDDPYADYFTVFRGTAAGWLIDRDAVTIQIRDFGYKLDTPSQSSLYGGTGGADGGTDLASKRKPRAYGYCNNVPAPLLVPNSLIYAVSDGEINAISAVYDRGVGLVFDADYANYSALAGATIASGEYGTCLAEGLFRLGAAPSGTITADVQGEGSGSDFLYTTADIVQSLVLAETELTTDDLFSASFNQLNTDQAAEVGYWLGPDDTSSVADVVADLMSGVGGWGGFRRDGLFYVRRFVAPTAEPVIAYYDDADIMRIGRERLPDSVSPPPWRHRVAYGRAWTTQTDLGGSVSAAQRALVAEPWRLAEASDTTVQIDHPLARDPDPVEAYFRDQADAEDEAERLLAIFSNERAFYRIVLPRHALRLDLGDVINITYDRWDLSFGRAMTIVTIREDLTLDDDGFDSVEITAYG